jgi:hypothetical protein
MGLPLNPTVVHWLEAPHSRGLLCVRKESGWWNYQPVPHRNLSTEFNSRWYDGMEFGDRAAVALAAENVGSGWRREDIIAGRAYDAMPGLPFMEFLGA